MINNFISILLFILCLFLSCAPVPPIQSSRITSNLSNGPRLIYNDFSRKVQWGIEEPIEYDHNSYYNEFLFPRVRWYFTYAIKKRVEFSGPFFFYLYGPMWGLNCKTFLFEIGQPRLFRNFCTSLFIGSNGALVPDNEEYNIWGGCVFGTYAKLKKGELEIVFQPSGTYTDHWVSRYWWHGPFIVSQTPEDTIYSTGKIFLNRKSIDLGFGIIYKPLKDHLIELIGGVTYKYYFDKDFYVNNQNIRLLKYHEAPFYFHMGLVFNIIR